MAVTLSPTNGEMFVLWVQLMLSLAANNRWDMPSLKADHGELLWLSSLAYQPEHQPLEQCYGVTFRA